MGGGGPDGLPQEGWLEWRMTSPRPQPEWRDLLESCTREALEALSGVPGVVGLVLAGSVGRGEPWPLSDIDVLPVLEDRLFGPARQAIEERRIHLLDTWTAEAHPTTLDVGRLAFRRSEVLDGAARGVEDFLPLLHDPRWFHSLDKGYQGRASHDPEGVAATLAALFTRMRFDPRVREARVSRHRERTLQLRAKAEDALQLGEFVAASGWVREAGQGLVVYLLERWGDRDNSLGRLGTRLDRLAAQHGQVEQVETLWRLVGLGPEQVPSGIGAAPPGVRHRHRRSYPARRLVGEDVTEWQDARDVLFVFGLRAVRGGDPPFPSWLGLAQDRRSAEAEVRGLGDLLRSLLPEGGPGAARPQPPFASPGSEPPTSAECG